MPFGAFISKNRLCPRRGHFGRMENTINVNQESHGVKHTGIPAFLLGNFITRLRRWPENKTALLAILDHRGRVTVCCVLDCALWWAQGMN